MIAVAGLNSAIDKLIDLDALSPGGVLRAGNVQAWPGGKGVHVAACAAELGAAVRLTGLVDDGHREWFAAWLRARRVDFHAIDTPTPIRTCLAIRESSGRVTEILEAGPTIDEDVCEAACHTVLNVCRHADIAVLSGSLPRGMPSGTYARLIRSLPGTRVLLDASGDLLLEAKAARPFAIKPNRREAEALIGAAIDSVQSAAVAARTIAQSGVPLVIISLGSEGAVVSREGRVWRLTAPAARVVNDVGAGDCLLGGVAAALTRGDSIEDAVRLGVAAGTAKVLSPETGVVRRADIDAVLPSVTMTSLA